MADNMSKKWTQKMPKGMDLEISHHPPSMKQVVNLIIAMERLKSGVSESLLSSECRDEHLLNILLESIIEEQIVFERGSAASSQFSRTGMPAKYSVTDKEQKSLVLVSESMELSAVLLQGGAEDRKVFLNMSTYVNPLRTSEARTVALGIKGTKLYLSCHKEGDRATLHLEEVEERDSLLHISSDSDMMRFLFYKQDTGRDLSTLVSVPHNDWYISTAKENNKPVEMCLESAHRHKYFKMQRQI